MTFLLGGIVSRKTYFITHFLFYILSKAKNGVRNSDLTEVTDVTIPPIRLHMNTVGARLQWLKVSIMYETVLLVHLTKTEGAW